MKKLITLAFLAGLIVCSTGCSTHWANTTTDFDAGCWDVKDTLNLEFESNDTSKVYALGFPITFSDDYPFNNIYLHAILRSPSGEESNIPAEFVLSDPAGNWLSEPEGDLIPFQLKVSDGLRFNQTGKYTLRLVHFMRDDALCGVQSAGIFLDPLQI